MSHQTDAQRGLQRLRMDSREDENFTVIGYLDENGEPRAWTGDRMAPDVHVQALPISWIDTKVLVRYQVVRPTAGALFQLHIYNTGATKYEFQLHDAKVEPTAGAVPKMVLPMPAGGTIALGYGELRGRNDFYKGIVWVLSTTVATYTPIAGACAWATAAHAEMDETD